MEKTLQELFNAYTYGYSNKKEIKEPVEKILDVLNGLPMGDAKCALNVAQQCYENYSSRKANKIAIKY